MVLFKRKPVQLVPPPPTQDDGSEKWTIPDTGEVFSSYEPYLRRMNFYKQRRFICEITGHSALTFFEAQRSEAEGSREVNNSFPEALKEPVLRKVQFSTISRIDSLVDQVFEDFKQDFYPGERVTVLLTNGTRLQGVVREKARFPAMVNPDGSVERRAYSRYLVKLVNRSNEEALVDDEHLARDRKIFTKQMLRSFIKNTVTRESWTGAPWLVKPNIAEEFRIDTIVPKHLQYGNKVAGKKAQVAPDKEEDESLFGFFSSQQRLPQLKPALNEQRPSFSAEERAKASQDQYLEYQRSLTGNPALSLPRSNRQSQANEVAEPNTPPVYPVVVQQSPPPPPAPLVKYPVEDLEIAPESDAPPRPALKFLTTGPTDKVTDDDDDKPLLMRNIKPESVGPLLETWNTLNVYCEVLQLDSFTFDDFIEAMRFSSQDIACELFTEIHCSVLKLLVNAENSNNGAIQIVLPPLPEEEESEDEEDTEEEPEPEPEPVRRTTRSSIAKQEAQNFRRSSPSSQSETKNHRAGEMIDDTGWIDMLRKRDFKQGGWEMIMVGLLHRLSLHPRLERRCNDILTHLAPLDVDPKRETAQAQYVTLDVNLRVAALQIISTLILDTRAVRNYLEECSNQMTEFRKEKIEHQRARKTALEELRRLHEERKGLEPEMGEQSVADEPEDGDVKMSGVDDDSEAGDDSDEDEEAGQSRSLRRGADRQHERKRRQAEARERKEQASKQRKGSKQYQRILKKIDDEKAKIDEYEEEIATVDNDLREADCPRTRVLGKDRFWNRYYWFERNGMPFAGLPSSSTAESGYANGRLWVQGPDAMEYEGFIAVPADQDEDYVRRFGMTVRERKEREEGPSGLNSATQWGYYDDPEALDRLLSWLDLRGNRELKLRKEIVLFRDQIAKYMAAREDYLHPSTKSGQVEKEDHHAETNGAPTRASTRHKNHADSDDNQQGKYACLRWRNTTAIHENGHLHVEASRPTKKQRKSAAANDSREASTSSVGRGSGRGNRGRR